METGISHFFQTVISISISLSPSSSFCLSRSRKRAEPKLQMALPFQSQCLHSHHSSLSRHIIKTEAFLSSSNLPIIAWKSSILTHKCFPSRSIFSRKNKKKRSGLQRFMRFVLKLIPIITSDLQVSPRPLHLIAQELGGGGGNGGGLGFWGGSGWGWFDGWRRRGGRRRLGFWVILVVCGLSLMMLVDETQGLVVCRILGWGLLGLGLIEGWSKKKGATAVKNGILGICFLGAVSFWGLRKEEVHRKGWVQGLALRRQRRRRPGKFW